MWYISLGCGAYAATKVRGGTLMLDVQVEVPDDNRRYSRAKKLADKIAKSYFKRPVMALRGVIVTKKDRTPAFRYCGRVFTR